MRLQQIISMIRAVTKEKKKKQKKILVPPVIFLQGQVIVREGETISSDMYNQLKLVGLLEKGNSFQPYVGLAVLIGVLLYFMHKQFEVFLQRKREDKPYILAYIYNFVYHDCFNGKLLVCFKSLNMQELRMLSQLRWERYCKTNDWRSIVFLTSMIFSVCGSIMFNEGVTKYTKL